MSSGHMKDRKQTPTSKLFSPSADSKQKSNQFRSLMPRCQFDGLLRQFPTLPLRWLRDSIFGCVTLNWRQHSVQNIAEDKKRDGNKHPSGLLCSRQQALRRVDSEIYSSMKRNGKKQQCMGLPGVLLNMLLLRAARRSWLPGGGHTEVMGKRLNSI